MINNVKRICQADEMRGAHGRFHLFGECFASSHKIPDGFWAFD